MAKTIQKGWYVTTNGTPLETIGFLPTFSKNLTFVISS